MAWIEWIGMETELNGMDRMEWNGTEWNGMGLEWNGMVCMEWYEMK